MPAHESLLVQAETDLGFVFPPSYREFLLRTNGGLVEIPADTEQMFEFSFFSLFDDPTAQTTTNSLLVASQLDARDWPSFPHEALAIGADGEGNYFILLPGKETIYFWEHDGDNDPLLEFAPSMAAFEALEQFPEGW